jgi:tetratricopeptide (TPR) repeat protein
MLATFGMRPPGEVYPRFLETHERAVAVGGLRAELRANRGHGLHLFEEQLDAAEAEFLAAIAEKPSLGMAYVRAALLYVTMDRLDDAAAMLERCEAKDPLVPTLPGDERAAALLAARLRCRDRLRQAGDRAPPVSADRAGQLRQALEFAGRLPDALAQYKLASVMSPDLPWLRALEATCLAKMGQMTSAQDILEELEHLRRSEYVDAFYQCVLRRRSATMPRR